MTNEEARGMTNEEAREVLSKLNIAVAADATPILSKIQVLEATSIAIKALEQTSWIPVSERLPEDYVHVLCQFYLGGMGECYLAHGAFHVVGGLVMTCNEVIAWMPRPQAYTESE